MNKYTYIPFLFVYINLISFSTFNFIQIHFYFLYKYILKPSIDILTHVIFHNFLIVARMQPCSLLSD